MNVIDNFLKEDMLITKPSLFVYIPKDDVSSVGTLGIRLNGNKISSYLTRLPENNDAYSEFLLSHYPVRISVTKLFRIKDQNVKLIPVNITKFTEKQIKDSNTITDLISKYGEYLTICYNDKISLDEIPHIDIIMSGGLLPSFVLKILKDNSFEQKVHQ